MQDDQLILDGIRHRIGTLETELTTLEEAFSRVSARLNPPAPTPAAPAAPKRKRVRRTKAQLAAAKAPAPLVQEPESATAIS